MRFKTGLFLLGIFSYGLSNASCLIHAYKASYDFTGGAEGEINSELSGSDGNYKFNSEIVAHKFLFTGKVERDSEGVINKDGFQDQSYTINEGFNNVHYDVNIDYKQNEIISKQENKIYKLDFSKNKPIFGKIIYPQQLRYMLLKNPEIKNVDFNIPYHQKNAHMEIVKLPFAKIKTEKLKTPLGDFETEVFEAKYTFENQNFRVVNWYAENKDQLLVKSEVWVGDKLEIRTNIKTYQPLQQCVITDN